MKSKIIIEEDTVTPYLEYIQETVNAERETLVKEATKTIAYSVANQGDVWSDEGGGVFGMVWGDAAPYNTGALLQSGLNPRQQVLTTEEYKSIIDLYWTGMYADYSWWEFRYDSDTSKPPDVDYARFQETGDTTGIPHSESKELKARHKGFFTKMVGDRSNFERIRHDVANEYMKILLKK